MSVLMYGMFVFMLPNVRLMGVKCSFCASKCPLTMLHICTMSVLDVNFWAT